MKLDVETINEFVSWLRKEFPKLVFQIKKPLYELFPEPIKYKGFWKHKWAHIDIAVFRHGKLVCAIEPGGFQHLTDKKQIQRDRKKAFICKENNVMFLPVMNSSLKEREHPQFMKMLKAYFYSEREELNGNRKEN